MSSVYEKIDDPKVEVGESENRYGINAHDTEKREKTQESLTSSRLDGSRTSINGRRGSVKVNLTTEEHNEAAKMFTFRNMARSVDDFMRVVLVPMNILIFVSVENVCVYLMASCKNMSAS